MFLRLVAWVAGTFVVGTATHIWRIFRRIARVQSGRIRTFHTIPTSLYASMTVRQLVNPRQHVASFIAYSMPIELRGPQVIVSDEAILARFVQGVFFGPVLALERTMIRFSGLEMTHFTSAYSYQHLWSPDSLPL